MCYWLFWSDLIRGEASPGESCSLSDILSNSFKCAQACFDKPSSTKTLPLTAVWWYHDGKWSREWTRYQEWSTKNEQCDKWSQHALQLSSMESRSNVIPCMIVPLFPLILLIAVAYVIHFLCYFFKPLTISLNLSETIRDPWKTASQYPLVFISLL